MGLTASTRWNMKVTPSGMSFETDRLQDQPLVDLLNEKDEKGKWSMNGPSKAGRKNASFFLSALSSMGHSASRQTG